MKETFLNAGSALVFRNMSLVARETWVKHRHLCRFPEVVQALIQLLTLITNQVSAFLSLQLPISMPFVSLPPRSTSYSRLVSDTMVYNSKILE